MDESEWHQERKQEDSSTHHSQPMFISSPPPISALRRNLGMANLFCVLFRPAQLFQPNIPKSLDSCIYMLLSALFGLFLYNYYSSYSSKRLKKMLNIKLLSFFLKQYQYLPTLLAKHNLLEVTHCTIKQRSHT